MTEISDAEAAKVLWASSEQGAAAVKAAWDKAKNIGLGTRAIDAGDIGAIVYAAYLAAGWGADPAEDGHLIAFLAARIDDDEAAACRGLRFAEGRERDCPDGELVEICEQASRRERNYDQPWWAATVMALRQQVQLAPHDPARALREVTAMRAIIAFALKIAGGHCEDYGADASREILTPLAAVWSDHPDYRAEWAPDVALT